MSRMTRREALRKAAVAGAGAAALGASAQELVAEALAAAPRRAHASLRDIEHVIILIQENRSFDSYFGMFPGVRGFGDSKAHRTFLQKGNDGATVPPFHFPVGCMADITHDWAPQHQAWNHGRMDQFLIAHQDDTSAAAAADETMGYFDKSDIPLYYALAEKFTICDGYHCSVIGPTDPNRLMSISAWIDPHGTHGGPLVQTRLTGRQNVFSWTTMPEVLSHKGISWKNYTDPSNGSLDSVFTYFTQYQSGPLSARGLKPTYPDDFLHDLSSGKLPQVSWLTPGIFDSEHPGFSSPQAGELAVAQVMKALLAHPDVWRKTALFITWDENGGFFDHVPPPTPRPGTKDEFLTVGTLPEAAGGIRGPIGLGFRVPMLVVSPFSRGGLVSSDTFDHTSMLRFLETRFGARVPNLSAWRRKTTGDLTSAFNFAAKPNATRPSLPQPGRTVCTGEQPITAHAQPFPRQPKAKPRRPSGVA
ncbi:MAG TPA: alkaline phosphatase family protein [Solirubrobacteraceae bacterium]|nr:alkaline phosphatase family protein [Solirubrobacteraceae bacterium]